MERLKALEHLCEVRQQDRISPTKRRRIDAAGPDTGSPEFVANVNANLD